MFEIPSKHSYRNGWYQTLPRIKYTIGKQNIRRVLPPLVHQRFRQSSCIQFLQSCFNSLIDAEYLPERDLTEDSQTSSPQDICHSQSWVGGDELHLRQLMNGSIFLLAIWNTKSRSETIELKKAICAAYMITSTYGSLEIAQDQLRNCTVVTTWA